MLQESGSSRRMLSTSLCAFVALQVLFTAGTVKAQTKYYGKLVGNFKTYAHDVKGTVYIANENTIFIKDFEYDGQGPDAYFWGDVNEVPTREGFIIPIENGTEDVLKRYNGQNLILTLPNGTSVQDIKSLSVWCRKFMVNFGSVIIPSDDLPYEKSLGPLPTLAHAVRSDDVIIKDSRTISILNLYYDGAGPDAFFLAGRGPKPHGRGSKIPDENGSLQKLHGYNGENVTLQLPGDLTVFDIDWMGLYCIRFDQNFGHVFFPEQANVPANIDDLRMAVNMPYEMTTQGRPVDSPMSSKFTEGNYYDMPYEMTTQGRLVDSPMSSKFTDGNYYDMPYEMTTQGRPVDSPMSSKLTDGNYYDMPYEMTTQGRPVDSRELTQYSSLVDSPMSSTFTDGNYYDMPYEMTTQGSSVDSSMSSKFTDGNYYDMPYEMTTQGRSVDSPMSSKLTDGNYYGKLIAEIKTNAHDVKGTVFAASDDTFYIMNFSYDGEGPDAFFWAGTSDKPSPDGFIIPDEFGTKQVLGKYSNQNVAITLPDGKKISDIKWLSVWCRKFAVNFGYIMIPDNIELPKEANLGPLSSLAHGVRSGNVIVRDSRTIYISNLHYDGAGPDAFFLVGNGDKPHRDGTKVPDENGSLSKLHGYQGENIELRLPDGVTVFDVDWLSMFCIAFEQNFGDVRFPRSLNVPADLKTLKAEVTKEIKFDNCEELFPGTLHVSWKIMGHDLILQMEGRAEDNVYMAFGRSGNDDRAAMIGSDVIVAFYDADAKQARVDDYYLSAKSQCSRGSGACPDTKFGGNNNAQLLNWKRSDGVLTVTYKRPLGSSDGQDLSFPVSIPVSVVAAIGPLNSQKEVAFHTHHYTKDSKKIHFGRSPPQDRCNPLVTTTTLKPMSWPPLKIVDSTTFTAQIGPTGGDKGYTAITGSQSWGIAWWMNGLLIPELTVRRGTNYTFIVEGGNNPSNTASYHPLYITNNPEGGGGQFLDQVGLPNHTVYAGININANQNLVPTGVGRMCEWKHKTIDKSDESSTFEEYKTTLLLDCSDGHPGTFYWTPDENTPDLVYYQCFTHRNLGWKIHVVDAGAKVAGAMEHHSKDEPNSASTPLTSLYVLILVSFIIML